MYTGGESVDPTAFFLKKRYFTFILIVLVAMIGIKAMKSLRVETAPEVNTPVIYAAIPLPGAAPEEVESLVTNRVEEKISEIEDMERFTSSSWPNVSIIVAFFKETDDPDKKFREFREKIDQVRPFLPKECMEPIVEEVSFENLPMMYIGFNLKGKKQHEISRYAEKVRRDIEKLPGVKKVIAGGATESRVEITLKPDAMEKFGPAPLRRLIEKFGDINTNMPGGPLTVGWGPFGGKTTYTVRTVGRFDNLRDLRRMAVGAWEGRAVPLSEVADVGEVFPDPHTIVHVDGERGVTLAVMKKRGWGTIGVADSVRNLVEKRPGAVIMSDSSASVRHFIGELKIHALWGVILVMVVLFATLGFRVAGIVSTALPLSFFMTFIAMSFRNMTLDMVSLFSFLLALGMMVDNSIVVCENIYRHMSLGKSSYDAALEGTNEVRWPIVTSTAAVAAAFLPMGIFLTGPIGEFTRPIPIVVTLALVSSLIVANAFNPALCDTFLANAGATIVKRGDSRIRAAYRRLLEWCLDHRGVVISAAGLLLAACFAIVAFKLIGLQLFPQLDTAKFYIDVKTPPGSTIEKTFVVVSDIEKVFKEYDNYVNHYIANVGSSGTRIQIDDKIDFGPNIARFVVDLKPRNKIDRSHKQVVDLLRFRVSEAVGERAKVTFTEKVLGPPVGDPIDIQVSGDDYDRLETAARRIREMLEALPGVVDVRDDAPGRSPQVTLKVKQENLGKYGLTTREFGGMIFLTLTGYKIGEMVIDGEKHDIHLKIGREDGGNPMSMMDKSFKLPTGETVMMSDLVETDYKTKGLSSIEHENGRRTVSVKANVRKGFEAKRIVDALRGRIDNMRASLVKSDPEMRKVDVAFAGENAILGTAMRDLSRAVLCSLLLIYLILLFEFRSTLQPLIILVCVPYALVGVIFGLLIMHYPFSVLAGIGLLCLIGIVVNNGIIFIDYANLLRRAGKPRREACIEACLTRLRPIVLTKATVILGIIPMALAGAAKTQFWKPMCWAIIWGLLIATTLTLVIIPVVYFITEGWRDKYNKQLIVDR